MKHKNRNNGSILILAVFVTALLAAVVAGMLQMSTEEIQLMQNHLYAAEALATAEAGLNDALASIGNGDFLSWEDGYTFEEDFNGGSYSVTYEEAPDPNSISEGTSSQGFTARVKAEITIDSDGPFYVTRIDSLRINE